MHEFVLLDLKHLCCFMVPWLQCAGVGAVWEDLCPWCEATELAGGDLGPGVRSLSNLGLYPQGCGLHPGGIAERFPSISWGERHRTALLCASNLGHPQSSSLAGLQGFPVGRG